jgi:CRISPR-associated protein Csm4
MKRYIIKPLGPWHLQTGGLEHEQIEAFPRSDTLSAALLQSWITLFGSDSLPKETWPFRFSSVFPCIVGEESTVFLYPKPRHYNPEFPEAAKISRKEVKKIKWITEKVLELISRNETVPLPKIDDLQIKKGILALKDEKLSDFGSLGEEQTRTRVVIDRLHLGTVPFQFTSRQAGKSVMLYFLANLPDEHIQRFEASLTFLGDQGIGADRTVGMGQFEWIEPAQIVSFNEISGSGAFLNLGLFNPDPKERKAIEWSRSFYDVTNRQGWTAKPTLRRKNVRMVEEGSVLITETQPLHGRLVEVLNPNDTSLTPGQKDRLTELDHTVYRDGQSLFIPVIIP